MNGDGGDLEGFRAIELEGNSATESLVIAFVHIELDDEGLLGVELNIESKTKTHGE